jgi:thiol:disulfide interchange protein
MIISSLKNSKAFKWTLILTGLVGIYFANVELQSFLGRKAMHESGLDSTALATALENPNQSSLPILAQFSAEWCGACRQMTAHVLSDPKVRSYIEQHFRFSHVEYEDEKENQFFDTYSVSSLPTVVIFSPQGKVLKRISYTIDPQEFLGQIQKHSTTL